MPTPKALVRAAGLIGLCFAAEVAAAGPALGIQGEHRARYESLEPEIRPALDERETVLALRTRLALTLAWPKWRFLGELMDSRAELNTAGSLLTTGLVNSAEPLELAATRSWTGTSGTGAGGTLRFGRMTVDLGSRRLIARNVFRNTLNSFVGLDGRWQNRHGASLRAFYLAPVRVLPAGRRDLLENAQHLDEIAASTRIGGWLYERRRPGTRDRLEVYWVDFDTDVEPGRRDIRTLGSRMYRPAAPGSWFYELEIMRQTGVAGGVDHNAHFGHLELGFAPDRRWPSSVSLRYDLASGDRDPDDGRDERFDTLFGARRFELGPTGIFGAFARGNLRTPGLKISCEPGDRWRGNLSYRTFRLDASRDAWTTTGLRDPTGQSGDDLGSQIEVSLVYRPRPDRLKLELGAAALFKGDFVDRTDPERSARSLYYYVATTIGFQNGKDD